MVKTSKPDQLSGLEKAWSRFKKKDFEGALGLFEEILEEKHDAEALYGRACALFRCEEYDDSLKDLNELLKEDPKNSLVLHTRALVYGACERLKDSIKDLEKVVTLKAESVEAWCDLGGAYLLKKEYALANEYFDKGIDIDKTCPDSWFGKGMVALEKKEYKKAIEFLNAAIRLDAKFLLAILARAEAYFMTNQKKEAALDVARANAIEPGIFSSSGSDNDSGGDYDEEDDEAMDEDQDFDSFKLDD